MIDARRAEIIRIAELPADALLTLEEAGAWLGIRPREVVRKVPHVDLGCKTKRVRKRDLLEWVEGQIHQPARRRA